MTQNNLGNAYRDCIDRGRSEPTSSVPSRATSAALQVHTLERFPMDYAMTQNNLGIAYHERIEGDEAGQPGARHRRYEEALRVRTLERFPQDYAMTQNNLGNAYREPHQPGTKRRTSSGPSPPTRRRCGSTPSSASPRTTPLPRTTWACAAPTMAHGQRAAAAWEATLDAQEFLLALSGSVAGRDATAASEARGAATRAALCACCAAGDLSRRRWPSSGGGRVGWPRRSGCRQAIQRASATRRGGRATSRRARRSARRRSRSICPSQATSWRRRWRRVASRSNTARDRGDAAAGAGAAPRGILGWRARRRSLQAKAAFDAVVAEVRAAGDPADFLLAPLDLAALQRAAARGGAGHALVYLGATRWGGMALGVFTANSAVASAPARVEALDLPLLTSDTVFDLIQRPLAHGDDRLIGGYAHAQEGNGLRPATGRLAGGDAARAGAGAACGLP